MNVKWHPFLNSRKFPKVKARFNTKTIRLPYLHTAIKCKKCIAHEKRRCLFDCERVMIMVSDCSA